MNKVKKKARGRPLRSQSEVDLQAIGQRIRELRGQVTQEKFAALLRISQAQLSKYELGQSAPPLGVLAKLATSFGKTVDWILTGHSDWPGTNKAGPGD
jgi:DNA-binding transcriptional regulator YiaG